MEDNQRGLARKTDDAGLYQRGTNYFLGICIDTYKTQKALRNCVNDVTCVHDVLVTSYDFEQENMFVLKNEEATRRNILKKLQEILSKLGDNDSLVFMYSGHGTNLDGTNMGFMIPVDDEFEEDFINLSDIKSRLDTSKAKHIFVVFDACFSGLILTQRDVRKYNIPENIPSRFALTSGRNSPVSDGDGSNSPFATALLEELKQNDESLGAGLLSQKILDRFRETGRDDEQLPNFGRINEDIKYQGQYYFYPKDFEKSLARERTKRLEAEDARKVAEEALLEAKAARKAADEARFRAEKLARAAQNAATFMRVKDKDTTLALRMMQYNLERHYDSDISFDLFNKTLASRTPLYANILRGHESAVMVGQFLPDGDKILTGSANMGIYLWDIAKDSVEKRIKNDESKEGKIVFSPDGKKAMTVDENGKVVVWHLETMKMVFTHDLKLSSIVCAAFSPDGQTIVLSDYPTDILFVDVKTGKVEKISKAHNSIVDCLVFSPDGKRLLSCCMDGTVKLWQVATRQVEKTIQEHRSIVSCGVFSADGQYILTGSDDKTAVLWHIETEKADMVFWGSTKAITSVAFSTASHRIATGCMDGSIMLWDTKTGEPIDSLYGHRAKINSLDFSPDGRYLLTGSSDDTAKVWHLTLPKAEEILGEHDQAVSHVLFSPDAQSVFSIGGSYEAYLWQLANKENPKVFGLNEEFHFCTHISSEGQMSLVSIKDKSLLFYDILAETAEPYEQLTIDASEDTLLSVSLSPDGQKIVIVTNDLKATVWDRVKKTKIFTLDEGENLATIVKAVFSPDGQRIATVSTVDYSIILWDATTGKGEKVFNANVGGIHHLAFSPDGRKIASCGNDKLALLWDVTSGELEQYFKGHSSSVYTLAFSKDGTQLLTGSEDGTAKIWNIDTGIAQKTFISNGQGIYTVAFSPDGQKIALGCEDKIVELWDVATGSIDEMITFFPLFEMAEEGLLLEAGDTPQYLHEIAIFVEDYGLNVDFALEVTQKHLNSDEAVAKLKKTLKI